MLQKLQKLVIDEGANLEKLDTNLKQFNYFEILGITYRELQHSNFLYWLLNPKSSHNLGTYFLKNLINLLPFSPEEKIKVNLSSLETTKVFREYHDIDLLIVDDELKFTVCIENKIKSGKSGDDQLVKYYEVVENIWGEKDHNNYYVYLTPYPRVLTKQELEIDYVNITYLSILEMLEDSFINKSFSKEHLVLVENYVKNLKKNIMGLSKEALLAQEIYKKHKAAIDFIITNKPSLYSKLLYAQINDFFISSEKYENLTPNNKGIIRIIPKSVKSIFDLDSHSWEETTSIFALEIFIEQESIWMKFCFGNVWRQKQEELESLQRTKSRLFDEMKKFKSISKGVLARSRSTSKYPSVANFIVLNINEKIIVESENYFEAFKINFEKFEKKTLNNWIEELNELKTRA